MKYVVGVFAARAAAESALDALECAGISEQRLSFLTPDGPVLTAVPITETEGSGVGMALGAVVGGAIGLGGGLWLGLLAGTAFEPAMDSLAIGLVSGAMLGICGALGGFVAGGALEEYFTEGLPKDELLVYEDAVRQGRSVVITAVKNTAEAEAVRELLDGNGTETVDAARDSWWVGLRPPAYSPAATDPSSHGEAAPGGFELAQETATAPSPQPAKRRRSA